MFPAAFGDLAQGLQLRRQSTALKAEVQRLAGELTTGRRSDPARAAGGDLGPLADVETARARLAAFAAAAGEASRMAGAMQTALQAIERLADPMIPILLNAASAGQGPTIGNAAADAAQRLESLLSVLNTRFGDRALFAGVATDGGAVTDAGSLLAALEAEIAGAPDAAAAVAAVAAWFADPGGYAAQGYRGGPPLSPLPVAPGDAATLDLTAADPALGATIEGLALAALVARGTMPGDAGEALQRAGERLIAAQAGRTDAAARLGLAEGRIADAEARLAGESAALEVTRSALLAADPYETAARLEAAQGQLEALFAVTARLSRLSLVDFLR
jgi:flagellar hook-associated protein 3 FlgL